MKNNLRFEKFLTGESWVWNVNYLKVMVILGYRLKWHKNCQFWLVYDKHTLENIGKLTIDN